MSNEENMDMKQLDQTRNRLLAAGLNLLAIKGYRGAITREIAMEAGVTEVTMYRHFRSKEDLFAAAITEHAEQLINLVPEPSGNVETDLLTLATGCLEHISSLPSKLMRIIPGLTEHPKLKEIITDIMRRFRAKTLALCRYYQSKGELIEDVDDVIFTAFVGPIYFSSLGINVDDGFDCRRYVKFFINGYCRQNCEAGSEAS
ncbi:MAG: TetR/AcrR family transcriptional regulator [Armatimonadetes bacterium]|jgi:hypothetical protein|nr:TetR/AcrR family transcriptional regulator [Armatimonadota bacterium]